ncbi:phospholipase D1 isoform X1 [Schistocerca piceifrons]|uniref:phospholipase D1 isoform X1 n=1 Tax=Schistocerca piceifrons TaxID=274613 RepID=UPI001F5FA151|nr:phospholipase D1 isoform X1 [Schistocerca piceifrons]
MMTDACYVNEAMADEQTLPTSPTSQDSDFDEFLAIGIENISSADAADGPASMDSKTETNSPYGAKGLPFNVVHSPPVSFKALHRHLFIPHVEIKVKIIDVERSVTTHILNPNLYTLAVQHGDFTWQIKKRYSQFQQLHQQLIMFRTSLNVPFPSRSHREKRHSFRNEISSGAKKGGKGALPRFPNKPEALVPYEDIDKRCRQLEDYLNNLLRIRVYRMRHETAYFLEVSHLSFVRELGLKGKEGMVLKRTGSTQLARAGCDCFGVCRCAVCVRCSFFCGDICASWRQRWLFVKDTYLGYIRPKDGRVKCVMLFDSGFEVSSGIYATGLNHGMHIFNLSRQLIVKCWSRRNRKEWLSFLKDVTAKARDFTMKNRFNSFAPIRSTTSVSWFVDGCSYMSAVADALEAAKEEIFIADWWLSPEIHMKRPAIAGDTWRLDKILTRKAENGVKVFVMLYKEVELALGINSYYSKRKLTSCNPNIKVLRHPDHAKAGVLFWAHHEKLVVIDQTYAFVGGIDLCYGRWDDNEHRLVDLGSVSQTLATGHLPLRRKLTSSRPVAVTSVPQSVLSLAHATNMVGVGALGGSYSSINSSEAGVSLASETKFIPVAPTPPPDPGENEKQNTPEMARRNLVSRVIESTGQAREWISKLYRGNEEDEEEEINDKDSIDGDMVLPHVKIEAESPMRSNGTMAANQNAKGVRYADLEAAAESSPPSERVAVNKVSSELTGMAKFWIGKDYTNFIVKDFHNLEQPYKDLVDRNTTPRMPWHDIAVLVQGAAARDVARHFIQRWNAIKLEKMRLNPTYPFLLPKSYEGLDDYDIPPIIDAVRSKVNCQVVRSASSWSAGFLEADTWEESIHEAYLDIITQAKHYIYIENQFFISLAFQSTGVRNQIGETILKRIIRAHKQRAVFRVFVVMPLLPGFEGDVGSPTSTALHAVTHWNYASISRGKDAILNKLKEAGIEDPSEYITFHGLRTHSVLNGDLVSELIYVHSKLLIADDNTVICGSANINDRSLIGKRDSEVAVVLQDIELEDGVMNGQPYKVGRCAASLRKQLFREHLGLLKNRQKLSEEDIMDPVSHQFFNNVWKRISTDNTKIYEEVFRCIPSDQATSFSKLKKFQEELSLSDTDPSSAEAMLENVQGFLVNIPLEFLKDEILTPNPSSVEGILPTSLWT